MVLAVWWVQELNCNASPICNDASWTDCKARFNKQYRDIHEEQHRRQIYCQNQRLIGETNSLDNLTYKLASNVFTDRSWSELSSLPLSMDVSSRPVIGMSMIKKHLGGLPDQVDWRFNGRVVGPIKEQADCNAYMALASVALLESMEHKWEANLTEVV